MYRIVEQPKRSETAKEKYIVISPGRTASKSLFNHIHTSLNKLHIDHEIENLETPMLWVDTVEDPEKWTVVISTRNDMLAQVLSFYVIILTAQTHKIKDVPLENFVMPRVYFFAFAYGLLFFNERVFNFKNWDKFKKVHWFVYEDIIKDWQATGKVLGFDDWEPRSKLHAKGYGSVWDNVINKEEVLSWAKELQLQNPFTFNEGR